MSDIFISYASEDLDWVVKLSALLRDEGWTVWWDRSIPFGKSFQEVIEKALNEASCVIVVWSQHSVNSGWVSAEADEARNRGILVPVLIENVSAPLVFRQLQTANLTGWKGEPSHPIYQKLLLDLGSLLDKDKSSQTRHNDKQASLPQKPLVQTTAADKGSSATPQQNPAPGRSPLLGLSIAAIVVIGILGIWFSGILTKPPEKESHIKTPDILNSQEEQVEIEHRDSDKEVSNVSVYANMFDEAMLEGQLDLAARFVKKAHTVAADDPETLRISAEYEAALQQQVEEDRLAQQQKEQQEAEEKSRQAQAKEQAKDRAKDQAKDQARAEAEAIAEEKARLARLAEEQRQREELQQQQRLEQERKQQAKQEQLLVQKKQQELAEKQRLQALEEQRLQAKIEAERRLEEQAAEKERLQAQIKLQEKELVELQAQEEKSKAEEEAQRLLEEEIEKEKRRQRELRRRMLSR